MKLNTEDLKEMQIKIGPRKKIMNIISELEKNIANNPIVDEELVLNSENTTNTQKTLPFFILSPEIASENEMITTDGTKSAPVASTSKEIQSGPELEVIIPSTSKSNVDQEITKYSCVSTQTY